MLHKQMGPRSTLAVCMVQGGGLQALLGEESPLTLRLCLPELSETAMSWMLPVQGLCWPAHTGCHRVPRQRLQLVPTCRRGGSKSTRKHQQLSSWRPASVAASAARSEPRSQQQWLAAQSASCVRSFKDHHSYSGATQACCPCYTAGSHLRQQLAIPVLGRLPCELQLFCPFLQGAPVSVHF